jgi:IrrE N-terminal-like domain
MRTVPGQLSLLEQARLENPGQRDERLVGRIAAETIEFLAERPPVDLEVVAAYRGIEDIRLEDLGASGSLTPEPGGLVMRLNRGDSAARRRFTGFHEVAHTFQPGYRDAPQLRCEPSGVPAAGRPDKEVLSDLGAVELLLPREFVAADLAAAEFGLSSAEALAARYQASVQASTYRMSALWPEPTIVIVLEPGLRKEERGRADAEPRLRVLHAVPRGNWPVVPRNKSAADESPLVEAFEGDEEVRARTDLSDLVRGGAGEVEIAAKGYGYRGADGEMRRRVMAIARRPTSQGKRQIGETR